MLNDRTVNGKKIALVGGAGFIGHNLALQLKEAGATPLVIDGLQVNSIGALLSDTNKVFDKDLYIGFVNERLDLIRRHDIGIKVLDVRDYDAVSRELSDFCPDAIVHLAAVAHANRSNKDPYSTFDHSLRTLENVLDNCKTSQTHIVYLSSSMVYGDFHGKDAVESQACNPLGIYGSLKYAGEKIVIAYNQVFGVPYTIVRPSALYGERCVSRRVIQAFIENARSGFDLSINGGGSDALDFTYIDDLVQGIIRCLCKDAPKNEVFNLTYGESRSILELSDIVRGYFPKINVVNHDRDNLMPERGTLSIEKAKKLLGYVPKYKLEDGLASYIAWYSGHK